MIVNLDQEKQVREKLRNFSPARLQELGCPIVAKMRRSLAAWASLARSIRHAHWEARVVGTGSPLVVTESETRRRKLKEGQVRLAVGAAGVNNADLAIIRGKFHLRPDHPFVPGFELAGEVLEVGPGTRVQAGDRVVGVRRSGLGAWATELVLHDGPLLAIPHSLSYEKAVALPVAYCTALLALRSLKEGKTVMVITAQGSTGMGVIDLAQNLFKCKVIGASDTEDKCAEIRSRGVLATVEYKDENLVKKVKKLTNGRGVDLVVDTVGGFWFDLAIKCMAPGGEVVTVGFSSGTEPSLSLSTLIQHQISVRGVWLGGYAADDANRLRDLLARILEYADDKFLSPYPPKVFPLDKVNEAVDAADIESSTLGKVILSMRDKPDKDS